jgi:phosphatidylserine/phosphatidylglycerophosphate/cardiolipin synthase-like enzyme
MLEPQSTDERIARLVTAVWRLDSPRLLALARVLGEKDSPPSAGRLRREVAVSTGLATDLARKLASLLGDKGPQAARDAMLVLTTVAHARKFQGEARDEVEIVCTAPARLGVAVRTTFAAAVEMVEAARKDIMVVGYLFTEGATKLIEEVARVRRERRVRVTIVGNRMADTMPALRAAWPSHVRPPTVFSREGDSEDDISALHAKVLVCDGSVALVTSANFSRRGLHENLEIGVKVHSSSVGRIVELLRVMIETGQVVRVPW